jgi:hypothetical protein
MKSERATSRWSSPVALGILVGLGALLLVGLVGAPVGFLAGVATARHTRLVLISAAFALFVTAVLTLIEEPLNESGILAFPQSHGVANVAGAIAATLLLAGLAGLFAGRDAVPEPERARQDAVGGISRVPASTVAAILAASLLGCFALWRLGDSDWGATPLVLAIVVVLVGTALLLWRVMPSLRGGGGDA